MVTSMMVLFTAGALAQEAFMDHGVAAAVAESRGVVALQTPDGRALVLTCSMDLSPRGWILVTDVDSGETHQYYYPEGVPNSPPFASLASKNGRFYTFAGNVLLEFDPVTRQWLFNGVPAPSEACYVESAMADGPDGRIWAGSHPHCHLVSFDPATKEMKDHGALDPQEQYVMSLVLDAEGWAYAGIGTARCNIVAVNTRSGERRQIVPEEERTLGSGSVYLSTDGNVYGAAAGKWYRMRAGQAERIEERQAGQRAPTGAIDWGRTSASFPDGRVLRHLNLPERYMEIEDPQTKQTRRITFDYQSEGAMITSMIAGPDGRIHGSTAHPMHWFAYAPGAAKVEDWGPISRINGGNICAFAVQGQYMAGAAYSGGWLYLYDTTKPWNGETGDQPNPRMVAEFPADICRPRTALAHPDGRSVLMGGFMGYGRRGGGIAIYDIPTGQATLLTHEQVIPDQSTITLKALPNGDLVGGTSVECPGGGHPTATEGVLYIMEWKTKRVLFQTVPVRGAREICSLEVARNGLVFGVASGAEFFVFNPETHQVVHRESLAQYGGLPRQVLLAGPDGMIYAIFTGAIVRIDPVTFKHEKLASSPGGITAGVAILGGRLYFAIGSHVWSYGEIGSGS